MNIFNQQQMNMNFSGKLIIKGKAPYEGLESTLLENPAVDEFLKSDRNLVVKVKKHIIETMQPRYNVAVSTEKENPNVIEKIKYQFGLNKSMHISNAYLSETKINKCLDKRINSVIQQLQN